ncbi:hypothetical protein [Bacillus wiedmannii]|uniref:Uncharacterized protein n=1 Tax=Bacillus wiedmannii TaxID=1890302 RepID=A0A2B6PJE9_9BACI|nr:hypothetical protein [Bacillus wiedmannii]PEL15387.1 hypothetical protein CN599_25090 [Bacillus wiedmannii]PEM45581.1 hypothetical protein CN618_26145 [Bacillus wiedmannii]PFZ20152.1 hypothetical protein COL66_28355 [Bacillus wiedmannii]PGD04262.1 hypothetical protein COM34_23185 [Bacillus wiedmannii]PHC90903.1 hypothetical protein COF42_03895 [Bacillus wiedmannii]
MWNIKEKDLDEFKITCRNRLSPEYSMGFMFGGIVYSSLFMLFILGALFKFGWGYYPNLFDKIIVSIELVLYGLQVIFFILYLIPKARFKYQKLQAFVILLFAFQLGTIGFTLFILPAISNYSIDQITLLYVGLLFLGAVFVHLVTTIDTFKQAESGAFSMDERATSFFSKTKGNAMIGVTIYVLTLLILIYFHNNYETGVLVGYMAGTLVMYAVAIGAAEFQLLAYCRFKFPSFYISWEEHDRERQEFLKRYKEREEKKAKEIK